MDEVLRAVTVYGVLLIIFRLAGKRSLAETTAFDFVLLLIFSEALQSALVDEDHSLTAALVVILTLVLLDIVMSLLKQRSSTLEVLLEGAPIVIVEDGKLLQRRMWRARVDEGDILAAARQSQGLERLDQIKLAVLERSGGISVVPKEAGA